eukprot:TRINITY_DN1210_c0_g1_i1.p1 TRINITY_DN1210_c0_g1~~TRINITY_DN1210_c0_g1_i1.p1  ORF type:complete len:121 (+),score=15.06 TRINITY_DN1210_c0_g1_i1:26-364(+)
MLRAVVRTNTAIKGMRTTVMGKRVILRRADLSDAELERGVRPFIDQAGDYRGELPEQPEMLTHWNANWNQGGPAYTFVTPSQAVLAVAAFLGTLFLIKTFCNEIQETYPDVV